MASNDKTGWRCPICEIVNTGDICTICGTKIEQKAEVLEISQNNRNKNTLGLQTEISVTDHSSKDSAEELQWRADKWKRIVAIVILAVISLVFICALVSTGAGHLSYNGSNYDENIVSEDDIDIVWWDSDHVEQICSQLDIVNVEISGGYNDDFGLNKYGEFVYWDILIQINDDLDSVTDIQTSWTDNVSCINNSTYVGCEHDDYGWQSVLKGNTHWYSYTNYDNANIIEIKLPDDPGIAGEQYIIINGVKINFSLNYLGDYITGIGWDISDIFVTLASSTPDHNNEDDLVNDGINNDENVMIGDLLLWGQGYLSGEGCNESGEPVCWLLDILYYVAGDEEVEVLCSWDNIYQLQGDICSDDIFSLGWKYAKDGKTICSFCSEADGTFYDGDRIYEQAKTITIGLPDDPSIEGTQYIFLNDTKIAVDLIYEGNYSTATGWNYDNVQY